MSAFKTVWLIRHGQTAANKDGIVQGGTDVPLNETGVQQAEALARWLEARNERPARIVTSPLSRARRTAEIINEALKVPFALDERLVERHFGEWEGRSFGEVHASWTEPTPAWESRPPGGESPADLLKRVSEAFDELASEERDEDLTPLCIVAHGGVIGALVCRTLGLEFNQANVNKIRRDNTGLTILRRRSKLGGGFGVATLNATFHLD